MPLAVSKLKALTRRLSVPFSDEEVNVDYRLGAINRELADWIVAHGEDRGSVLEAVTRLVARWDVVDGEGQPLPITPEVLEEYDLPTPFLMAIVTAVFEDASPGNVSSGTSGAGSRPRGKPENSRDGTSSFA